MDNYFILGVFLGTIIGGLVWLWSIWGDDQFKKEIWKYKGALIVAFVVSCTLTFIAFLIKRIIEWLV